MALTPEGLARQRRLAGMAQKTREDVNFLAGVLLKQHQNKQALKKLNAQAKIAEDQANADQQRLLEEIKVRAGVAREKSIQEFRQGVRGAELEGKAKVLADLQGPEIDFLRKLSISGTKKTRARVEAHMAKIKELQEKLPESKRKKRINELIGFRRTAMASDIADLEKEKRQARSRLEGISTRDPGGVRFLRDQRAPEPSVDSLTGAAAGPSVTPTLTAPDRFAPRTEGGRDLARQDFERVAGERPTPTAFAPELESVLTPEEIKQLDDDVALLAEDEDVVRAGLLQKSTSEMSDEELEAAVGIRQRLIRVDKASAAIAGSGATSGEKQAALDALVISRTPEGTRPIDTSFAAEAGVVLNPAFLAAEQIELQSKLTLERAKGSLESPSDAERTVMSRRGFDPDDPNQVKRFRGLLDDVTEQQRKINLATQKGQLPVADTQEVEQWIDANIISGPEKRASETEPGFQLRRTSEIQRAAANMKEDFVLRNRELFEIHQRAKNQRKAAGKFDTIQKQFVWLTGRLDREFANAGKLEERLVLSGQFDVNEQRDRANRIRRNGVVGMLDSYKTMVDLVGKANAIKPSTVATMIATKFGPLSEFTQAIDGKKPTAEKVIEMFLAGDVGVIASPSPTGRKKSTLSRRKPKRSKKTVVKPKKKTVIKTTPKAPAPIKTTTPPPVEPRVPTGDKVTKFDPNNPDALPDFANMTTDESIRFMTEQANFNLSKQNK